ncbi:MAG: hypothetical protein CM1200mP16_06120 [Nitrospina sp.]|nr:MAG: hypothetical protein CM1200mP16_06120 [Nitrospina sp.]
MAGNVREWVKTGMHQIILKTPQKKNPTGPQQGILKVIKGGSWHSFKAMWISSRGKGGFALKLME